MPRKRPASAANVAEDDPQPHKRRPAVASAAAPDVAAVEGDADWATTTATSTGTPVAALAAHAQGDQDHDNHGGAATPTTSSGQPNQGGDGPRKRGRRRKFDLIIQNRTAPPSSTVSLHPQRPSPRDPPGTLPEEHEHPGKSLPPADTGPTRRPTTSTGTGTGTGGKTRAPSSSASAAPGSAAPGRVSCLNFGNLQLQITHTGSDHVQLNLKSRSGAPTAVAGAGFVPPVLSAGPGPGPGPGPGDDARRPGEGGMTMMAPTPTPTAVAVASAGAVPPVQVLTTWVKASASASVSTPGPGPASAGPSVSPAVATTSSAATSSKASVNWDMCRANLRIGPAPTDHQLPLQRQPLSLRHLLPLKRALWNKVGDLISPAAVAPPPPLGPCWYCRLPCQGPVCRLPLEYDDMLDAYFMIGSFCSWPCVKAYNCTLPGPASLRTAHMYQVLRQLFGIPVAPVQLPPLWSEVEPYGALSAEAYRQAVLYPPPHWQYTAKPVLHSCPMSVPAAPAAGVPVPVSK